MELSVAETNGLLRLAKKYPLLHDVLEWREVDLLKIQDNKQINVKRLVQEIIDRPVSTQGVIEGEIVHYPQPKPQADIRPATDDEILIVIMSFKNTHERGDAEGHFKILEKIVEVKGSFGRELELKDLRVEHDPTVLRSYQREEAKRIGQYYNANMVIWGEDTPVNVTVHYLNLKDDHFPIPYKRIESKPQWVRDHNENDRSGYIRYVTKQLPAVLNFLSLFAVGHSYYREKNYEIARKVIKTAIHSLDSESSLVDGRGQAHLILGLSYYTDDNSRSFDAVAEYGKAIQCDPHFAFAYYLRGIAYDEQQVWGRALDDYDKTIELEPKNAYVYDRRAVLLVNLYRHYGGAIEDSDTAIKLRQDYPAFYANRVLIYLSEVQVYKAKTHFSDYDEYLQYANLAVEAFERAIEGYKELQKVDSAISNNSLGKISDSSWKYIKREIQRAKEAILIKPVEEIYLWFKPRLSSLEDECTTESLIAALQDDDAAVRGDAVEVLCKLGDKQGLESVLATLKHDEDQRVRQKAVRALRGFECDSIFDHALSALYDKSTQVQKTAIDVLGELGNRRAVEPLIEILQGPERDFHYRVADALGKLGDSRAVRPLQDFFIYIDTHYNDRDALKFINRAIRSCLADKEAFDGE